MNNWDILYMYMIVYNYIKDYKEQQEKDDLTIKHLNKITTIL